MMQGKKKQFMASPIGGMRREMAKQYSGAKRNLPRGIQKPLPPPKLGVPAQRKTLPIKGKPAQRRPKYL
jgi:hypothetical protein